MGAKITCNEEAVALQAKVCELRGYPLFIPADGICRFCGKDIFGEDGYPFRMAALEVIRGCPHCNKNFFD